MLAGTVLLFQLQQLPSPAWAVLIPPLAVVAWKIHPFRPLFWGVAAFLWAAFAADHRLSLLLPDELERRDIQLVGRVVDLPRLREDGSIRFLFQSESARIGGEAIHFPALVRLGWYREPLPVRSGEQWRLQVRMKQPHGFRNPGGFDWEQWLFQRGIRATGYVREHGENRLLQPGNPAGLNAVREELSHWLRTFSPTAGVLAALAVGDRQGIGERGWEVFRQTGTSHLMAISGLHVGLVSTLFFLLFRWGWSMSARLPLLLPAQQFGAVGGFVGALGYAALAGFAIPTQRALVMVSTVLIMVLLRRALSPWSVYFTAMAILLLFDPFVVLSAGFWLSFGAVGLILHGVGGSEHRGSKWVTLVRIQWILAIGMLPMLLFLFRQGSLIAPLSNLVAVPWISLVVVPLNLLASLFHLLSIPGAESILWAADQGFRLIWPLLEWFADLELSHFRFHQPPLWAAVVATAGVVLLVARPAGVRRWFGLVALLPMLLLEPSRPEAGEAWVTVLDVGQGLSVVVEGSDRVMVYDTGDRFSDTFDAGSSVLVPFLESRGWKKVDLLVIGHGDRDHIGGMESLLESLPVVESISSVPERVRGAESCRAGMNWSWNGVSIEVIHPQEGSGFSGNNGSCVVRIDAAGESVLLSGDIERGAERSLLRSRPNLLKADLLVVPHHGSKTSSTGEWIDAVSPRWAIFPVGYLNRYRLPREEVVERYRSRGINTVMTADAGAVQIELGSGKPPARWRPLKRRIWSD